MVSKVKLLNSQGFNIIPLTVGEPDFDTNENVKLAAIEAIKSGFTKYTDVSGYADLKNAICQKLKKENNIEYKSDEIVVSTGAKQVIYNALVATLDEGDEVIIPAPYWVSYVDMVDLVGGKTVVVTTDINSGFKLTPKQLDEVITPRTKWLILNSPNNPSGSVYSKEELEALAEILIKHPHVYLLTDDIYEHVIFDQQKFYTMAQIAPSLKERILTVNGMSKAHYMTGWRVGYGAGPKELIKAMTTIQSQSTSNTCSISQKAAYEALIGPQEFLEVNCDIFQRRRDLILDILSKQQLLKPFVPQGTFFMFIECSSIFGLKTKNGKMLNSSEDFMQYLLDEAKVAVMPGGAFGIEGFIRISFALSDEDIVKALRQVIEACEKLS